MRYWLHQNQNLLKFTVKLWYHVQDSMETPRKVEFTLQTFPPKHSYFCVFLLRVTCWFSRFWLQQYLLWLCNPFLVLFIISQNAQLAELHVNLHQGPALNRLGPYSSLWLLAVSNEVNFQWNIWESGQGICPLPPPEQKFSKNLFQLDGTSNLPQISSFLQQTLTCCLTGVLFGQVKLHWSWFFD